MVQEDAGVRSIERAVAILRLIAAAPLEGCRLSDLAQETGLGKATTHRLMQTLVRVGFACQDGAGGRYYLGYELIRLGQSQGRYDIGEHARPALLRIARETGDTVFISVREGVDAICLDRQVGDFPIKTLTLNIGDRRPLGVGAGSLMLLAALPDAQVSAAIAANAGKLEAYSRYSPEILRKLVQRTRADGYAYNDGRVLRAMNAIAVPVMDAEGTVIAALSVASIAQRMTKKRISMIVKLLEHEAAQLRHVPVSVRQQGESV